jgi:hypothetical protein
MASKPAVEPYRLSSEIRAPAARGWRMLPVEPRVRELLLSGGENAISIHPGRYAARLHRIPNAIGRWKLGAGLAPPPCTPLAGRCPLVNHAAVPRSCGRLNGHHS